MKGRRESHPPRCASLQVIGGSSGFVVLQFFIYQSVRLSCPGISAGHAKFLVCFVSFGIFLLSIVGAVCSGTHTPSCKGNIYVHSISAVAFFIIYGIYMVSMSYLRRDNLGSAAKALVAVSIVAKLRWLPTLFAPTDVTYRWPPPWTET